LSSMTTTSIVKRSKGTLWPSTPMTKSTGSRLKPLVASTKETSVGSLGIQPNKNKPLWRANNFYLSSKWRKTGKSWGRCTRSSGKRRLKKHMMLMTS
jgi:hypothetical protein